MELDRRGHVKLDFREPFLTSQDTEYLFMGIESVCERERDF